MNEILHAIKGGKGEGFEKAFVRALNGVASSKEAALLRVM
jgi:hypothetical protein